MAFLMEGLRPRPLQLEAALAARHLATGTLVHRRSARDTQRITAAAALDGVEGLRRRVAGDARATARTVRADQRLAGVERALRRLKTVGLSVRPLGPRWAERGRAHVCRCLLAYDVAWHLRRALAPLLFDDADKAAGEARRASVVAPAPRARKAQRQAHTPQTAAGRPGQSVQTLRPDLATVAKHRIRFGESALETTMCTTPTPWQQRALDLLHVSRKVSAVTACSIFGHSCYHSYLWPILDGTSG